MPEGNGNNGHGDQTASAYFFFPCYTGDDGSRPAPKFVCSWRSPAILVNGAPHDGKLLPPDKPLQLSAVVTNGGALPAAALVTIQYAPMSAHFTDDLQIAAQFSEFWLSGETRATTPAEWTVPAGLPSHVCLLASIDSLLDPIPTPLPQSIADRHYSQCNLDFIIVAPGATISVPILLGAGTFREHLMHAVVRPDLSAGADAFARSNRLHLDPELARQVKPALENRAAQERGPVLRFNPRDGDHDAKLVVQMPKTARPGQAVILTVEQFVMMPKDERLQLIGSLAVVLVAG
jgi:hypothetical protein